jgi:tRNA pseudouridine55 synthase
VDGILVVAKPIGSTSHDIVGLVRRLSATKRVGHGGTLDPFATGVLPVFLGTATRLVEYHLGDTKHYRATVCFGASSTTDDLEGELTPVAGPLPEQRAVEAAFDQFRGRITQRPPDYSAVKVAGRRAYAMARAGETVELAPREVTIHALELIAWNSDDPARPIAVLDVECSAGTYVRALARDLGHAVDSGAYLGALTRTGSGPFGLEDAFEIERVRAAAAAGSDKLASLLLPVDAGLEALPVLTLHDDAVGAVSRGQFVSLAETNENTPGAGDVPIRVRDRSGRLIAIGRIQGDKLAPDKVLIEPLPAAVTSDRTRQRA